MKVIALVLPAMMPSTDAAQLQLRGTFKDKFNEHMEDVVTLLKQIKVKPENTVLYLRATAGARSKDTGKPLPQHQEKIKMLNDGLLAEKFGSLAEIPVDAADILLDWNEGRLAYATLYDYFDRNQKDKLAAWAKGDNQDCAYCGMVSVEQGGKSTQFSETNFASKHSCFFTALGMNQLWNDNRDDCFKNGLYNPMQCKEKIMKAWPYFPTIKKDGRYVLFGGFWFALKRIGMVDQPMKFQKFLDTMNKNFKKAQEEKKITCLEHEPVENEKEGKNCMDIVLLQWMLKTMMASSEKEARESAQIVSLKNDVFGWTAALMQEKREINRRRNEQEKNIVMIDAGSSSSKVWFLPVDGEPEKLEQQKDPEPSNMKKGLF